jgi:protein-tyrosine phosphatase
VIAGVVNLRDLGGPVTSDGRIVRSGLVHRSGHLGAVTAEVEVDVDSEAFERSGIRTVFDLRTVAEVTRSPDRVPAGVSVVHLDVLADATSSIAAHLEEIFADPSAASRVFEDGVIDRHYRQTYRNLVLLDSARKAYRELFARLVELDEAVLFHCTAGKDRTGWAAASLLTLLGVDGETVLQDYLRSNEPVLEAFRPYLDQFEELGGEPGLLEPAFLVTRSYLDAAFEAVSEEFGSIERYFDEALDVDAEAQHAIRSRLLDPVGR